MYIYIYIIIFLLWPVFLASAGAVGGRSPHTARALAGDHRRWLIFPFSGRPGISRGRCATCNCFINGWLRG